MPFLYAIILEWTLLETTLVELVLVKHNSMQEKDKAYEQFYRKKRRTCSTTGAV